MKQPILKTIVGAAAILALPGATWAEDAPASPDGRESSRASSSALEQSGTRGAFKSGGTFAGQIQNDAIPASGGVMVHDGNAYIIHRLQSEMSLPDGSKIQPNGTIEGKDGSLRRLGEDQMLTLDGRMLHSPFAGGAESTPGATPTESSTLGSPGQSSPRTDGSTNSPAVSTEPTSSSSSPGVGTSTDPGFSASPTSPSQRSEAATTDSNARFTPGSSPTVQPEPQNPLESTSPGSGLQDTSPLSTDQSTSPATDSSTTEPFRDSNGVSSEPGGISADPTRDQLD